MPRVSDERLAELAGLASTSGPDTGEEPLMHMIGFRDLGALLADLADARAEVARLREVLCGRNDAGCERCEDTGCPARPLPPAPAEGQEVQG